MGYVVKAKVGETEENKREGRSRMLRKDVLGCVQSVVGKTRFLFKLIDIQKKYMSSSLLVFFILKEEFGRDEPLLNSHEK